jgi:hypothetical protein
METTNFKLGIGWPLTDTTLPMQFVTSFLTMDTVPYTLFLPTFPQSNRNIDAVRNDLVTQALDEGCSHLLMLDTDQIYPSDTITKLLSHRKMAVGATVHRRWPPFDAVLYLGDIGRYKHIPDSIMYSGDLVEVDATGTGCILFDMKCFKITEYPWFSIGLSPKGEPIGEDIAFCSKLRKTGVKIFVDTSIEIDHMTTFLVNRSTYQLYKNIYKYEWAAEGQEGIKFSQAKL